MMTVWKAGMTGITGMMMAALLGVGPAAMAQVDTIVQLSRAPQGSLGIVNALTELASQFPAISSRLQGVPQPSQGALSSASCAFTVYRPDQNAGRMTRAANQMSCSYQTTTGHSANLVLGLGDIPIGAWGQRFENSVDFKGELAEAFFKLISRAVLLHPQDGIFYSSEPLQAPDGTGTEFVAINEEPGANSAGSLVCSRQITVSGESHDFACVVVDTGR